MSPTHLGDPFKFLSELQDPQEKDPETSSGAPINEIKESHPTQEYDSPTCIGPPSSVFRFKQRLHENDPGISWGQLMNVSKAHPEQSRSNKSDGQNCQDFKLIQSLQIN